MHSTTSTYQLKTLAKTGQSEKHGLIKLAPTGLAALDLTAIFGKVGAVFDFVKLLAVKFLDSAHPTIVVY